MRIGWEEDGGAAGMVEITAADSFADSLLTPVFSLFDCGTIFLDSRASFWRCESDSEGSKKTITKTRSLDRLACFNL